MTNELESAWQRSYDASSADEDRRWAEQHDDHSWFAVDLRVRSYFMELMLIAGMLAGSIALVRTGEGWFVAAGIALLVVWVLSVVGLITVVWRRKASRPDTRR